MNAPRSSGVSGNGTFPDQGALRLSPTGDKTGEQSCEVLDRARQFRVYLPDSQAKRWRDLLPSKRSRAVAAVLGAVDADIDLHRLIDAAGDLRRLGILLNQAVRLAHQGHAPLDVARILAVVEAIEALKP
jgi:hypothetical protein